MRQAGQPLRTLAVCCMALLYGSQAMAEESWWSQFKNYVGGAKEAAPPPMSEERIAFALRALLNDTADYANAKLGHYTGFTSAADARIALPPDFEKARRVLDHFGLSGRFDNLELQMNRAAEDATPLLRPLIGRAINDLNIQNPGKLAAGSAASATQALRAASEARLMQAALPIIDKSLNDAGAHENLRVIRQTLASLPMAPQLRFDITAYVTAKTLEAIFKYMADRESDIRSNPSLSDHNIVRRLFKDNP